MDCTSPHKSVRTAVPGRARSGGAPTLACLALWAVPAVAAAQSPPGWSAAPALDLEPLQGTTVQVRRHELPWPSIKARARLSLQNSSAADITSLCIGVQPLRVQGSKLLVDGAVTVRRLGAAGPVLSCSEAAQSGTPLPGLKARERLDFEIELGRIQQTGVLQLGLDIISPSLPGPQKVTLQLDVSDSPGLAWLTIFGGVVLAFLVNFFTQRWRVQQQNRQRLIQIQIDIERLRATATSPLRLLALSDFSLALTQLEAQNDGDSGPGLSARIDELARQVEAFGKEASAQLVSGWTTLSELEAQLTAAAQSEDPAITKKLEAVRNLLDAARSLLSLKQGDAAEAKLKEARQLLATLAASGIGLNAARPEDPAAPLPHRDPHSEIVCLPATERRVNMQLHFELRLDGRTPRPTGCVWDFGNGKQLEVDKGVLQTTYLYDRPGRYLVQCKATMPAVRDPMIPDALYLECPIAVLPTQAQTALLKTRGRMLWLNLGLSGVALIVASITGLGALYFGKSFGSLQQYVEAFLWGLGMDTGVRGLAAVSKALNLDPGSS
jgi:hypothetical protein